MNRVSLVLVLAVLIMTWGLFAQQKNVTFAQPTAVSQGDIMLADNVEVQKTTTTTKEKRKHHHRKQHKQRKTTTTTERPRSEENRTNTTTTIENR
jgi:predicted membrane metal-binding protein